MAQTDYNGNSSAACIGSENLSIEVTTRCTNECSHCFARAGRNEAAELSREICLEILDEGFHIGYRHLHITGGEPLLWPFLYDLLDHACAAGYRSIFLNTNGSLVTFDTARRFAAFGERLSLSISIQGKRALHDRICGDGSFQKAVRGAHCALDAGLAVLVFTALGKSLAADFPRFAEFVFKELAGVTRLMLIQLIRVSGDAYDLAGELLSPDDFICMVRSAALLNLAGYTIGVLENPLANAAAGLMGMPWLPPALPLHRRGKIVVMADRSITLAHSTRESYGIYEPGMLQKVLVSDDYTAAVSPDTEICPVCKFHSVCMENCMIRPSERFRDMNEKTPFCQRVLDLL